jgi:hypothetical protein
MPYIKKIPKINFIILHRFSHVPDFLLYFNAQLSFYVKKKKFRLRTVRVDNLHVSHLCDCTVLVYFHVTVIVLEKLRPPSPLADFHTR